VNYYMLSVTVNEGGSQADPTSTLPITFDVAFSKPIDPASFDTSDITQTGTASGITWNLSTGDNQNYMLTATEITTDGTVQPSIAAGSVQDPSTITCEASTSTDNQVTFNDNDTPPSITFTAPTGNNDAIQEGNNLNISWNDADPDSNAQIALFYKTTDAGPCGDGASITSGIGEDDTADNHPWDTSGLATDIYYICAIIDDGENAAVEEYSGQIVIYDAAGPCVWTGWTNTSFITAGTG